MIYEIINPSDPYTITGDFKTCCVATCVLGEGAYGLKGGDQEMPLFLFDSPDEWFQLTFGGTFEDILKSTPTDALATCLDSVLCCSISERDVWEYALVHAGDERLALRQSWHDARRSSMNDIGRRAWALAERVKEVG